ncbi:zinc finger MYM-type protein 1 [Trichonephila clavata]|uniref:Zinc finger MYM-type protein 1 n=1 Tax=Trichonephila clavata TaxID=2740835 RepID=A0A8X6H463_TRICU|nr:zinc finger MYM-type protein 1 [Trichonephila clavata]
MFFRKHISGGKIKREWLMYSPSTGKVYCFPCILFGEAQNRSHFQTGFSDWKNALHRIQSHENNATHRLPRFTGKIKTSWRSPPEHAAKCPGLSLQCTYPILAQTTLSRLRTDHIKSLIFNGSEKTYASCRCSAMASPSHIIACIGASVGQLLNEEDVVFNLIKRHGLLDLV